MRERLFSVTYAELAQMFEKLAEMVGVRRETVIFLEQGKYNPSLELAYRITKVLKKRHIEEVFSPSSRF